MAITFQQSETSAIESNEALLTRALQLAQGFTLLFVCCNTPLYRAEVVSRLKQRVLRPIIEVDLTDKSENYPTIAHAAMSSPAHSILFVYGLETHIPSYDLTRAQQTLRDLNMQRSAYQGLARPLVFWLPQYALDLMAQGAPDFYDWNSGVFEITFNKPVEESVLVRPLQILVTGDVSFLSLTQRVSWLQLLENLWKEYDGEHLVNQQARLRVALQLGELNYSLGQYENAHRWLTQAHQLALEMGSQADIAQALCGLGVLAQDQGNPEESIRLLQQSLTIWESLNNSRGKAIALYALAGALSMQGKLERAMELYQELLAIAESLDSPWHRAAILHGMAHIQQIQGNPKEAIRLYQESLANAEASGNLECKAATLHGMADILQTQGDLEGAIRLYQESLSTKESLGNPQSQATTLAAIGQALLAQGKSSEGKRFLQQALEIGAKTSNSVNWEQIATVLREFDRNTGRQNQ